MKNSAMIGGRYWGPHSPVQDPHSPSKASTLLARINARARARKEAGQSGLNEVEHSTEGKDKSVGVDSTMEDAIATFLKEMRRGEHPPIEEKQSMKLEEEKEKQQKKKRKHSDLRTKEETNDVDEKNGDQVLSNGLNISNLNHDTTRNDIDLENNIGLHEVVDKTQKKKKKKKDKDIESVREIVHEMETTYLAIENLNQICNAMITSPKKKKKRKHVDEEKQTETPLAPENKNTCISITLEENEGDICLKKKKRKNKDVTDVEEKILSDEVNSLDISYTQPINKIEDDNDQTFQEISALKDDIEVPETQWTEVIGKKKKKKRKKQMEEDRAGIESAPEVTPESAQVSEHQPTAKIKKKKKKNEACDEVEINHSEVDVNDNSVQKVTPESEQVSEHQPTAKIKKKKKKNEACDEIEVNHSEVDVNDNSVQKVTPESEQIPEHQPTKERKKKKNRSEVYDEAEINHSEVNVNDDGVQKITPESEQISEHQLNNKIKKNKIEAFDEFEINQSEMKVCDDSIQKDTPETEKTAEHQIVKKIKKKKRKSKAGDEVEANTSEINLNNDSVQEEPKPETHTDNTKSVVNKSTDDKYLLKKAKKRLKFKERKKRKKVEVKATQIGGFTVLGEVGSTRKEKLQRTLPHWLAHPAMLSRNLQEGGPSGLEEVAGLADWLRHQLDQNNIKHFFPVQRAIIPELLASSRLISPSHRPRDICVSAPTGSGKTLAYVLPILQALQGRTVPRVRALVLLPVQELANQVYKVFETYRKGSGLKVGIAVGQKSFAKEQAGLVATDYRGQHCLVDILVATPGRLADHLAQTPGLDLSSLRYLVLDEADRMLAAEGGEWVARIEQAVRSHTTTESPTSLGGPRPPHRLLFSATLSHDPEQLQHITLHHPRLFTVAGSLLQSSQGGEEGVVAGTHVRPAELVEEYAVVEEEVMPLVLYHLICGGTTQGSGQKINGEEEEVKSNEDRQGWSKVLVFTNSVAATHRLAVLLGHLAPHRNVAEFSSSAGKKDKRQRIVSQFASGKIDVLVSTDAMARGLDIPNIEHVVSYGVTSVKTYVHRIGRTARAGRPGTALSLVTKDSLSELKAALSSGGEGAREVVVSTEQLEPYVQQYRSALATLRQVLQEEEKQRRERMEALQSRFPKGKKNLQRKGKKKSLKKPLKRLMSQQKPL